MSIYMGRGLFDLVLEIPFVDMVTIQNFEEPTKIV